MARLQFSVRISLDTGLLVTIDRNSAGTPSLTMNGVTVPYTNSSLLGHSFTLDAASVPSGVNTLSYTDDNGTRLLCLLRKPDSLTCFLTRYSISVTANNIIFSNVTPAEVSSQSLPLSLSIDGGNTFKSASSSDPSSSTSHRISVSTGSLTSIPDVIFKTKEGCQSTIASNVLLDNIPDPFEVLFIKTDVTVLDGNDGTLLAYPSGSRSASVVWDDTPTTAAFRTGLEVGEYCVTITDNNTNETAYGCIYIDGPQQEKEVPPFFYVPTMQSVRFVIEQNIDDCNTFQTLDNTLFCDQKHAYFEAGLRYNQQKNKCDEFSIQFQSSYERSNVDLYDYSTNQVVQSYTTGIVLEKLNIPEQFAIRVQADSSGKSRVYFVGSGSFPLLVEIGDTIEIINGSLSQLNGVYEIIGTETDAITAQQYLVIGLQYPSSNPSEVCDGIFINNQLPFNIYECNINLSSLQDGTYYLIIKVENDSGESTQAISEPISVKDKHENCIHIKWTNFDNANDIDYTNNITHSIRVHGWFMKRMPTVNNTGIRSTEGGYIGTSSKPVRGMLLETRKLPAYIHELLHIALNSDFVQVQGQRVTFPDGRSEPQYSTRYGLANCDYPLELVEWFTTYNSHDVGGVTEANTGFIVGNEGLIKIK